MKNLAKVLSMLITTRMEGKSACTFCQRRSWLNSTPPYSSVPFLYPPPYKSYFQTLYVNIPESCLSHLDFRILCFIAQTSAIIIWKVCLPKAEALSFKSPHHGGHSNASLFYCILLLLFYKNKWISKNASDASDKKCRAHKLNTTETKGELISPVKSCKILVSRGQLLAETGKN